MIKSHNLSSALKKHLSLCSATLKSVSVAENITDQKQLQKLIVTAYTKDLIVIKVIQALCTDAQHLKQFSLTEYSLREDRVYYQDWLFVSENDELRLKIFHLYHDSALAEHSETVKLLKIIVQTYWWFNWTKHMLQYLQNCFNCHYIKLS